MVDKPLSAEEREEMSLLVARWTQTPDEWVGSSEACRMLARYAKALKEERDQLLAIAIRRQEAAWHLRAVAEKLDWINEALGNA